MKRYMLDQEHPQGIREHPMGDWVKYTGKAMDVTIDGVKYVPAPPALTDKGLMDALEVKFDSDAGNDMTVRQWLCSLLTRVWVEEESFSGKRPWGNSGWRRDVLIPLAKAGFVDLGPLGDDGRPDEWTREQMRIAEAYVESLIAAAILGAPS